jgi:uncharacterized membrane protein (TIGR02234 family)
MTGAGRRVAVLLVLVGAAAVMLAATRSWAWVEVRDLPGVSDLTVSGRRAEPAAVPVALAAVAGVFVLAISGLLVRMLVAAGLVLAGAAMTASGIRFSRDGSAALSNALQDSLGLVVGGSGDGRGSGGLFFAGGATDITFWPWVSVVGAALIATAGLLVLIAGRSWAGTGRRFERAGLERQTPAPAAPVQRRDDTVAGTWDALSRGEDPTSHDGPS